jgi:hypothetical protein
MTELRDRLVRIIGSFRTHTDERGDDNQVIHDTLSESYDECTKNSLYQLVDDVLAEVSLYTSPIARPSSAGEKWKLVPIEPTEEMEEAADEPFHSTWKAERERSVKYHGKEGFASVSFSRAIWKAMLGAAPEPSAGEKDGTGDGGIVGMLRHGGKEWQRCGIGGILDNLTAQLILDAASLIDEQRKALEIWQKPTVTPGDGGIVGRLRYTADIRERHRADGDPIAKDCREAAARIETLEKVLSEIATTCHNSRAWHPVTTIPGPSVEE